MFYNSILYVVNLGTQTASCSLSLYGMSTSRLVASNSFTVPADYWYVNTTSGSNALANGYGRLDCTQPVYASLVFSLSRPDTSTAGMATVFSSPPKTYALLPMVLGEGVYYGVAVANDNDTTVKISVLFTLGSQTLRKQLDIAPRSQLVGFVNGWLTIPSQGMGTLEIVSDSGQSINVIGLLYSGPTFTTLVPSY